MTHPKREHQRVYFTFYLRVFDGPVFIGFIIDISSEGMMIMSEREMHTGKTYALSLKVPALVSGAESGYVTIKAQCQWCSQDDREKNLYLCGLRIRELPAKGNDLIRKLIETCRLR